MEVYRFNTPEEFLEKLKELVASGVPYEKMELYTPYYVHEVEEIVKAPASKVKFFTLAGAVTGFCTGMLFTSYTVIAWPLVTSGKPLISIPPFLIIAFELTILFGAICTLIGLLVLGRLPHIPYLAPSEDKEFGNEFVIVVEKE